MTALAANRKATDARGPLRERLGPLTVKDGVTIYKGALVVLEAGEATPGRTATGLVALGRSTEKVDNTNDGETIDGVEQGTFKWENSTSADEITDTEIGSVCYIVDDQTVAKTDGSATRSKAGIVMGVDSDGVWVKTVAGSF